MAASWKVSATALAELSGGRVRLQFVSRINASQQRSDDRPGRRSPMLASAGRHLPAAPRSGAQHAAAAVGLWTLQEGAVVVQTAFIVEFTSDKHPAPPWRAVNQQRRNRLSPTAHAGRCGGGIARAATIESGSRLQKENRRGEQKGCSDKYAFPGAARLAVTMQRLRRRSDCYFWENEHAVLRSPCRRAAAAAPQGCCRQVAAGWHRTLVLWTGWYAVLWTAADRPALGMLAASGLRPGTGWRSWDALHVIDGSTSTPRLHMYPHRQLRRHIAQTVLLPLHCQAPTCLALSADMGKRQLVGQWRHVPIASTRARWLDEWSVLAAVATRARCVSVGWESVEVRRMRA